MPLQNRVTPFGEIVAVPARGLFLGNRGIIHDPRTRTLLKKRWTTKAWIVCLCEFKGRRRKVMARQSWTELFFLDEATALAAGHRPCFYCRRADAKRFQAAFAKGNHAADVSAPAIDAVLHRERLSGGAKRRHPLPMPMADLPDGAMLTDESAAADESFLVRAGRLLAWSPSGYHKHSGALRTPRLLTPPSTLRAIANGYRPLLHESAFF